MMKPSLIAAGGEAARPLVLLYHRVANVDLDPWSLAVQPPDFERHVRLLSAEFDVVPLTSLIPENGNARLSPRTVAITFDDGYADNFEAAWPVLERYRAPATFFISSSSLESGTEYWWDTLERVLLLPGILPPRVSIESGEQTTVVDIAETIYGEADFLRHRSWRVSDEPPTSRHRAFIRLWMQLREMTAAGRSHAIRDLCGQAGIDPSPRSSHRPMRREEVRRMAGSPLVEIGAHTVSHGRLGTLPEPEQQEEISGSKRAVEALSSTPVTSFSYPFGGRDDYSSASTRLVRDAGYHRACAAFASTIADDCDRFQVPRCFVAPGGIASLARQLTTWMSRPAVSP